MKSDHLTIDAVASSLIAWMHCHKRALHLEDFRVAGAAREVRVAFRVLRVPTLERPPLHVGIKCTSNYQGEDTTPGIAIKCEPKTRRKGALH